MKNYQNSDYALNKYSGGIVYRFADSIVKVTLEDYLAKNPGKTEQDFQELKILSDAIYLDQVQSECKQTRKNVSIHNLEDGVAFIGVPLDEQFYERLDRDAAVKAFEAMMADGKLTKTQERRFLLHVEYGLSLRQIAELEGKTLRAVAKSVKAGENLLKKYFVKYQ